MCWYSMLARVAVIILYTVFRQAIGLYLDGSPLHPGFGINTVHLNTSHLGMSCRPFNISIDIWRATSEICCSFLYQKGWILSGPGAFQGEI